MTAQSDRFDFDGYLRNLTDAQVRGAFEKETKARRKPYIQACREELIRRGLKP